MDFDYIPECVETRKPLAVLYLFDGGPETCLAVKSNKAGQCILFYPEGDVNQQKFKLDNVDVVKKFYKGDSVTITF